MFIKLGWNISKFIFILTTTTVKQWKELWQTVAHKAWNTYCLMFYRKRLLTPVYTLPRSIRKRDVQIGQIILNRPWVLCSLWESLLFFQEMHLNQKISNHTLEWEELQEGKIPAQYWKQLFLLWAKSPIWKYRLWCHLGGKPETMSDGEPRAPFLLVPGGDAGEEQLRGFWMGTRRQALPPVEWRPETARSSPLHGDSQQFVLSPVHVFFTFPPYCVIWHHPCASRGWTLTFQEPGCIGLGFNPSIY